MGETFVNGRVMLHSGDCLDVLAQLEECSIDSCVTDPPYHLTSIVQRFGADDAAPARFKTGAYGGGFKEANGGTGAAFARMSRGFMGKVWDGGDVAFRPETWRAVYRVLKPGAHLVACGGTRTYHRMACAIEDAGFEIRDTISWLYGSGFPKSHDVSKGIDRAVGIPEQGRAFKEMLSRAVVASGKSRKQIDAECNFTMRYDTAYEKDRIGWGCTFPGEAQWNVIKSILPIEDGWDLFVAGVEREVLGFYTRKNAPSGIISIGRPSVEFDRAITSPATDAARQWQGWGTALKPACELIVLARKPLSEGTVAANVLKHGTGALNIDGCRIWADTDKTDTGCFVGESRENGSSNSSTLKSGKMPTEQFQTGLKSTTKTETKETTTSQICNSFPNTSTDNYTNGNTTLGKKTSQPDELQLNDPAINDGLTLNGLSASALGDEKNTIGFTPKGRWPANLAHDGSDEVVAAFPDSDVSGAAKTGKRNLNGINYEQNEHVYGRGLGQATGTLHNDTGSAARFFYTAKADADDRLGSKHPTVKPLDLMQWLVRLVTPKGGVVLDPFAGTGTTGEAAFREGMRAVLIEAEPEYQADIRRRMALVLAGPDERTRESIKAKNLPLDYGPLFGFPEAAE